jgi:hypothetical protein
VIVTVTARREQDLPISVDDERLQYRMARLIPEGMIRCNTINMRSKRATPAVAQSMDTFTEPIAEEEMLQLWVSWVTSSSIVSWMVLPHLRGVRGNRMSRVVSASLVKRTTDLGEHIAGQFELL